MRQHWRVWRWLTLGLVLLSTGAWAQQTLLEDVRVSTTGDRTRVVFVLSQPIQPKPNLFVLSDPPRLVVDMPNTTRAGGHPDSWPGEGVVKRFRTGRHGDDLRVVMDLRHLDIKPDSYTLLANDEYGHRLVVDLYQRQQTVSVAAAAQAVQKAQGDDQSGSQGSDRDSSQGNGRSGGANDAQTTGQRAHDQTDSASAQAPAQSADDGDAQRVAYTPVAPTREIVVAVDPGHGGHDPGAIGPRGTPEKQVVMAISRKLAEMIDAQPHMRAILTRTGDYYVGLVERRVIARKANADLFVSIHANASTSPEPHGVAVFALSRDGATSQRAELLAQRENSSLRIGGVSLENKNATLASFMLDLAQSATIAASLDVASRVLNNLDTFTYLHQPTVEQAAFVVLMSPDIPSILVETGFISNPREALKLQSDAYQTRLARAILRGIKGYFSSYRPGNMIAGAQVHVVQPGDTLSGIAATYHVSVQRLREYNNIQGSMIQVGQKIRIPSPAQRKVAALN